FSISSAMARAERVRVPLNAMCSSMCAMPFSSADSWRVPQATQMPSDADSTSGIGSTATRRPLARVVTFTLLIGDPLPPEGSLLALRAHAVVDQRLQRGGIVGQALDALGAVHQVGKPRRQRRPLAGGLLHG